jgi:hypothetical protein
MALSVNDSIGTLNGRMKISPQKSTGNQQTAKKDQEQSQGTFHPSPR